MKNPFLKISFFYFFLDDFRSFSNGEFEKKHPCHSFLGFAVSLSQAINPTAIPHTSQAPRLPHGRRTQGSEPQWLSGFVGLVGRL